MAARYLHVTSPLMTGPEVVRIQEKLTLLGYAPRPIDGEYGPATPRSGDIAIFNWDGGVPDHIGIVESYLGGGKFYCIEGNNSFGNNSNGGQVMRRTRYVSQVNGFGRVTRK